VIENGGMITFDKNNKEVIIEKPAEDEIELKENMS
jgi:hypothetical protein